MATYFLARILGPYLFFAGLAMIVHPKRFRAIMTEMQKSPALICLSGVLALIFGLVLVNMHNDWIADWPVVITIISWLILIKGLMRLFFWEHFIKFTKEITKNTKYYWVSWISLIVGAYLTIMGFYL